jgi:hypothetical protein
MCARSVPIAVPDVWIQYVLPKLKILCRMMISSAFMRVSMFIFSLRQMSGLSICRNLLMTDSQCMGCAVYVSVHRNCVHSE